MSIVLTSQEKKVLGFIVMMAVLGLVMRGIKKSVPGAGIPSAAATPAPVNPTPR